MADLGLLSDELIFICRFNLLLHNDAFSAA